MPMGKETVYNTCCLSPDFRIDTSFLSGHGIYCACKNCHRKINIFYKDRSLSQTPQKAVAKVMATPFPVLVLKEVGKGVSDHEVTELIFLYNVTDACFSFKAKSGFFTTVNDETGDALTHGPKFGQGDINPGELRQVGDVVSWEWDSVLGYETEVENTDIHLFIRYNLKSVKKEISLPKGDKGLLIYPTSIVVRKLSR